MDAFSANSTNEWGKQYLALMRLVHEWVHSANLPAWAGEEEEVTSDIVQEAICRTLERIRKAERQEATSVNSPQFLSQAIARNMFIDMLRKERRIIPLSQLTDSSGNEPIEFELADNAEDVDEAVFQEALFNELAPEVAAFPKKQRMALLEDIANHMLFERQSTPLQDAFLRAGINLKEYQVPLPDDSLERSRYKSLLSIAYKRIGAIRNLAQRSFAK